jgi:2-hydroxycyclohexanecarboxyl-CoA dehydrogenase
MEGNAARVALVTGAAGGIGRAIAGRLSEAGWAVALLDRDADGCAEVQEELRAKGRQALGCVADVTDFAGLQKAVAKVREQLGPVQVLVSNAGWDRIQPFIENPPELWEELIAINLKGAVFVTRLVVEDMIKAGQGRLIFISSDAARVGSSGEAVYAACKAGLIGFAKTLARELAPHGITVNVVCPGPTETPLLDQVRQGETGAKIIAAMVRSIPLRRLGRPQDVAAAVAFFASAEAEFITGQVLSVSGGLTMVG